MTTLVIGGTGTVGSEVVKGLRGKGQPVKVLTRSKERIAELPDLVKGVVGSLDDPASLHMAMRDVERLCLITPLSENESEEGQNAIEAAKRAGVKRIAYMSVIMPDGSAHIPHFRSKVPVEYAVQDSGAEWTIVRPTTFMQNDLMYQQVIREHGVYPQPIGDHGINLVDVRDIADALVNALTQNDHHGRIQDLNGPEPLTGERVAKIYSDRLGKPITYVGNDIDAWAENAKPFVPEWMLHDLVTMYTFFVENGMPVDPETVREQESLVGHPARTFPSFVAEVTDR